MLAFGEFLQGDKAVDRMLVLKFNGWNDHFGVFFMIGFLQKKVVNVGERIDAQSSTN